MRIVFFAVTLLASSCVDQPASVGVSLDKCGWQGPSRHPDRVLLEHPAIHEGGSYIGLATEEYPEKSNDPRGHAQRFSLVNCSTFEIIRVDAGFVEPPNTLTAPDLLKRISDLRKSNRLTSPGVLQELGEQNGWGVSEGNSSSKKRSRCACENLKSQ